MTPSEIADDFSATLFADTNVLAVLLVGSLSRGIQPYGADVDLAIFHRTPQEPNFYCERIGDVKVSVERYHADLPEHRGFFFDLKHLREVGRFTNGLILHSRWESFPSVLTDWKRAELAPDAAKVMFETAHRGLEPRSLRDSSSLQERLWMLQSAGEALTILALSMSPARYQKPKWVMQDLRVAGYPQLLGELRRLFGITNTNRSVAKRISARSRSFLEQGCELGGFPRGLARADDFGHDYAYVRRTFIDAENLLADGDFEGSTYSSLISLRLMFTLLSQALPGHRRPLNSELRDWRDRALAALIPTPLADDAGLTSTAESLRETGRRLLHEYKTRIEMLYDAYHKA